MKKSAIIAILTLLVSSAFANPTTQPQTAQPANGQPVATQQNVAPAANAGTQQPAATTQVATQQPMANTAETAQQKPKPKKHQKPKFSRNEMWCGDTHIKTQNADKLGDYSCKEFDYKHDVVQFKDDRSGRLVHCGIKDTGEINQSSCHAV